MIVAPRPRRDSCFLAKEQFSRTAWRACSLLGWTNLSSGRSRDAGGNTAAPLNTRVANRPSSRSLRATRRRVSAAPRCTVASAWDAIAREISATTTGVRGRRPGRTALATVGVRSGVQTERNRAQLRATEIALERRRAPGTPGSLRLGAGRSQVQILSPRSRYACKTQKALRRCVIAGCIQGCKLCTPFAPRRAINLALRRGLSTCDRKVWSRVVAGRLGSRARAAHASAGFVRSERLAEMAPARLTTHRSGQPGQVGDHRPGAGRAGAGASLARRELPRSPGQPLARSTVTVSSPPLLPYQPATAERLSASPACASFRCAPGRTSGCRLHRRCSGCRSAR